MCDGVNDTALGEKTKHKTLNKIGYNKFAINTRKTY